MEIIQATTSTRLPDDFLGEVQDLVNELRGVRSKEKRELSDEMKRWLKGFSELPDAPDLVVIVQRDTGEKKDTVLWKMCSPECSDIAFAYGFGWKQPRDGNSVFNYIRDRLEAAYNLEGNDVIGVFYGIEEFVGSLVANEFWQALKELEETLDTLPAILLIFDIGEDVPWEIAVEKDHSSHYRAPPLAARANIGRWIPPQPNDDPLLYPKNSISIGNSICIDGGNVNHAKSEIRTITELFQKRNLPRPIADNHSLRNRQENLLHIICHGRARQYGASLAILNLDVDGVAIGTYGPYDGNPFVFLNACWSGVDGVTLGSIHNDIPTSFIRGGAIAVIATAFSVSDEAASFIAGEFYKCVTCAGCSTTPRPSVPRAITDSAYQCRNECLKTSMAYRFFGHPRLKLSFNKIEAEND